MDLRRPRVYRRSNVGLVLVIGIVAVSPNETIFPTDTAFLCFPISWKDKFGLDEFIEQQNQCRAYFK